MSKENYQKNIKITPQIILDGFRSIHTVTDTQREKNKGISLESFCD